MTGAIKTRLEKLESKATPPGWGYFVGVTFRESGNWQQYALDFWHNTANGPQMLPWSATAKTEAEAIEKIKCRLHGHPEAVSVFFTTAATWKQEAGHWQDVKPECYKVLRILPGGKVAI
jgi:hypothetical protein